MSDMQPFGSPGGSSFRASNSRRGAWLFGLALLVAAGVGLWFWKSSRKAQPVAPIAEVKPAPAAEPTPPPVSMADGDSLLKQSGAQLSPKDELTKWLSEPDILRRLVAAVNLIAEGNNPRPLLGFLSPAGSFEVSRARGRIFASPKSYARYDAVTQVVTSVDGAGAAKTYGSLKPYLDAAFSAIGRPGKSFDAVLHEAIGKLLSTPIPPAESELEEKGLGYAYKDSKLEELGPAQKQLLRMGPANAAALQAWLKKLDEALPKTPP